MSDPIVGPAGEALPVRYRITHATSYRYGSTVTMSYNQAHILPRATPNQRVVSSSLEIDPTPSDHSERTDHFGNRVSYFSLERPLDELVVTARSDIDVGLDPAVGAAADESWEATRDTPANPVELVPFRLDSPMIRRSGPLADLAAPSFAPGRSLRDAVADLTTRIFTEFTYEPGVTTISTPLDEVLAERRGVCQDFAHLQIGALRSVGLAARYVSGYLRTLPPPGTERLIGADASHAWLAVRLADGSWLDVDPTNDLVAPPTHVTVAWGRDYADVPPLKGVVFAGDGASELDVSVDVAPVLLDDAPSGG